MIDALFTRGELEAVDRYLAPGFVNHDPFPGFAPDRKGMRQTAQVFRQAFPDWHAGQQAHIAEGDLVAERFTARGTHQGFPSSASGRTLHREHEPWRAHSVEVVGPGRHGAAVASAARYGSIQSAGSAGGTCPAARYMSSWTGAGVPGRGELGVVADAVVGEANDGAVVGRLDAPSERLAGVRRRRPRRRSRRVAS